MTQIFDVVVIGSGPAGGETVRPLLEAGLKVALVENYGFGGTCPLRGCEPKKVLVETMHSLARVREAQGHGLSGDPRVIWPDLMRFKDSYVKPVNASARKYWEGLGAQTFFGPARFSAPDSIAVNGQVLKADKIMLAPGARPRPLGVPGQELAGFSDDFLKLAQLPESLIILGGGVIALEFAQVAALAGAKVRLVHRSERVLRRFDADLSEMLLDACRDLGIEVHLSTPVKELRRKGDLIQVLSDAEDGRVFEAACVIQAVGRIPALEGMDLEAGQVEYGPRGVTVNQYQQSVSNPRVYSAGDAAATPFMLTPVAALEAGTALHNLLHGNERVPDRTGIPSTVFCHPPLAGVGKSEAELEVEGIGHHCLFGRTGDWSEHSRLGLKHGAYKLLIEKGTGRMLGAHILGHRADEVINLLALAMRQGISADDLKDMVWAYPTMGYTLKYMLKGYQP